MNTLCEDGEARGEDVEGGMAYQVEGSISIEVARQSRMEMVHAPHEPKSSVVWQAEVRPWQF